MFTVQLYMVRPGYGLSIEVKSNSSPHILNTSLDMHVLRTGATYNDATYHSEFDIGQN